MINPDKLSRSSATVLKIMKKMDGTESVVVFARGHTIECFENFKAGTFVVNERVNIQVRFSIMLDSYVAKTVRKIKLSKADLIFKKNLESLKF